ncbi:MAG: hypothetical protein J2P22_02405 [Nocardioides sp.]|nr:hypothetical protein [Nocardioides sp.]
MRPALAAGVVALVILLRFEGPATAEGAGDCGASGGLTGVAVGCLKSGDETNAYIAGHSDHSYSIRPACEIGGLVLCDQPAQCHVGDHDGWLYNVYQDDSTEPLDWQACLTKQEAQRLGGLTPGMVEHAFQRLAWPASPIVVQPPKGRTLVNFDTNFYTTNTHPTTQTVTLIGQQVTIEATPVGYTWHFGANASDADLSTSDPGAAYPDLRVTYRYTRIGEVHPSVDTTYAGRYRVGNGRWQSIPATLTVPGEADDLQVVSATPHLVGY